MGIMVKIVLSIFLTLFFKSSFSQVYVNGYYRKNGTYVESHYRSSPNSSPYDNYSFPGNTNPYSGKISTGNPDKYLEDYYNKKSGISFTNSYTSPSYSNLISQKSTYITSGTKYLPNSQYNSDDEIRRNIRLVEEKGRKEEEKRIDEKITQFKLIYSKKIQ